MPDLTRIAHARALAASGRARAIRQGARLSLREVARETGASPSAIHRWETGARAPRGEPAARYADLLDDLAALARRTVPRP